MTTPHIHRPVGVKCLYYIWRLQLVSVIFACLRGFSNTPHTRSVTRILFINSHLCVLAQQWWTRSVNPGADRAGAKHLDLSDTVYPIIFDVATFAIVHFVAIYGRWLLTGMWLLSPWQSCPLLNTFFSMLIINCLELISPNIMDANSVGYTVGLSLSYPAGCRMTSGQDSLPIAPLSQQTVYTDSILL